MNGGAPRQFMNLMPGFLDFRLKDPQVRGRLIAKDRRQ